MATIAPARPRTVAVHFLAAQAFAGVGALAVNVLSARGLGPTGRGQIGLWLQVGVIAGVLIMWGVDRAYPAVAARPSLAAGVRDLRILIRPGLTICVAAGACTAGWLLAAGRPDGWPAAAAVLVAVGSAVGGIVRAASAASGRSRPFLVATAAGQALTVGACALLLAAAITSPAVWLTAYGVALLAAFLAVRPARSGGAGVNLREVRDAGHRLAPSMISTIVMMRADRLMLPMLAGYAQLGIYGTIGSVTELISLPVQAYTDAHIPAWREQHRAGTLRPWRILAAAAGYAATAAAAGTVLLRALIVPVLGSSYQSGIGLVLPLTAAAAAYAVSRAGIGIAIARGRHRTAATIDTTTMLLSIGAYLLWIPGHGATGAAWGSLLGYGAAAVAAVAAVTVRRTWRR